jgi:hypothetical protein
VISIFEVAKIAINFIKIPDFKIFTDNKPDFPIAE